LRFINAQIIYQGGASGATHPTYQGVAYPRKREQILVAMICPLKTAMHQRVSVIKRDEFILAEAGTYVDSGCKPPSQYLSTL
jgi:hypothetical protein